MRLLIFLAVGFSITHAIVFLHVSRWLRKIVSGIDDFSFERMTDGINTNLGGFRHEYLGRLVRCHACAGFWVGVVLSILCGGFISTYMSSGYMFIDVMFDGFMLSGSNFAVWLVFRKLEAEEL